MTITAKDYCPNCDYQLTIEESDQFVRISDNGHTVTACPNCMAELDVQDGVLVEVR